MNKVVINSLVVALEMAFAGRGRETKPVARDYFPADGPEPEAVLQPAVIPNGILNNK